MIRSIRHALGPSVVVATTLWTASTACAAGRYELAEPVTDGRVFAFTVTLAVDGKLETSSGGGKPTSLDLKVSARLAGRERRLEGTGREAAAYRAVRLFDDASTTIVVGTQTTSNRLHETHRLILAQGRRDGVDSYCLDGPLTADEVELLKPTADPLALLPLLPQTSVDVGDKWTPDSWVAQSLTGAEAVTKSELTCRLASVDGTLARIAFEGKVEGATLGAATKIDVSGTCLYDLTAKHLVRGQVKQTERRAIGAVSPGADVTATVTVDRRVAENPGRLTDAFVRAIPLEPDPFQRKLLFSSPWNVRFLYDRGWHVFHQSDKMAIFRLMDGGNLIAQCNVTPIATLPAGQHTPGDQFQKDIGRALGDKLKDIAGAEELRTKDGRFLYRVTAVGEGNGLQMTWLYYLCAAPDGRQMALVFAVETPNRKLLADRDVAIAQGLEFLAPKTAPTPAP